LTLFGDWQEYGDTFKDTVASTAILKMMRPAGSGYCMPERHSQKHPTLNGLNNK
jgi:hypothetical protein